MSDIDALLPKPQLYRIAGQELRQAPLPSRKLLAVLRHIEGNKDLLEKFKLLGKPTAEGGVGVTALLETDVYPRIYAVLRLLLPGHEALMTDDWCYDHLTNAHIRAIVKTALVQNELDALFDQAKGLLGPVVAAAVRQSMEKSAQES